MTSVRNDCDVRAVFRKRTAPDSAVCDGMAGRLSDHMNSLPAKAGAASLLFLRQLPVGRLVMRRILLLRHSLLPFETIQRPRTVLHDPQINRSERALRVDVGFRNRAAVFSAVQRNPFTASKCTGDRVTGGHFHRAIPCSVRDHAAQTAMAIEHHTVIPPAQINAAFIMAALL